MNNQKMTTKMLCYTAIFTALVFLLTDIPKIPFPFGYAHLGDAMIFALPFCFPTRPAAVAAGAGSALADLLGGYPLWIVPTFLIKFCMVYAVFYVARPDKYETTFFSSRLFAGILLSAGWMIGTYALCGSLLYGSGAGTAMLPGLLGKGGINFIVAYGFISIIKNISFLQAKRPTGKNKVYRSDGTMTDTDNE